jgi:hypothetical protein
MTPPSYPFFFKILADVFKMNSYSFWLLSLNESRLIQATADFTK